MGDWQIGPAQGQDAFQIGRMSRRLIERGLTWRWRPPAIARQIERPDTEVVVARRAERIVGFGIAQFLDEEAHLVLFAVDPKYRRRGIGRDLLDWLEVMAETAMVETIRLEVRRVNEGARAFYRANGYRELELVRGYYEGVEDAVRMERRLTQTGSVGSRRGGR